jgi:hypothetical protein
MQFAEMWAHVPNPKKCTDFSWAMDEHDFRKDHPLQRQLCLFFVEIGRQLESYWTMETPRLMRDVYELLAEGRYESGHAADQLERLRVEPFSEVHFAYFANGVYRSCVDWYKVGHEGVEPAMMIPGLAVAIAAGELDADVKLWDAKHNPTVQRMTEETDLAWGKILIDIFSPNPYVHQPFQAAWRTETTIGLAQQMYETRNFTAMLFLADALEEAGCNNAEVLIHCREDQQHYRGCWVLDLVLDKQHPVTRTEWPEWNPQG